MADAGFTVPERLARGGVELLRLPLSVVLLKSDARWPWLILVPQRADAVELHALSDTDAQQLMREIRVASVAVSAEPGVTKINVAALGNQVRALHVHVVGRWEGDPAWPDPVFTTIGKIAYDDAALAGRVARLTAAITAAALEVR